MPTKVLPCGCDHKFQDDTYGKGRRLFNGTTKSGKTGFRCTVCGKEKTA